MRRVLRGIIAVLVALLSLGVCAWLVGRFTTDEHEWSQYLWWIPTPIVLMALAIIVILLFVRWIALKGTLASVIVALTIALVVGAYFAFVEQRVFRSPAENPDGVLIMHWNWTHMTPQHVDWHVDKFLQFSPDIAIMTDWQRLQRDSGQRARLERQWNVAGISSFTVISRWPILRMRPLVTNDTTHVAMVEIDSTEELGRPLVIYLCDMPSEIDIGRMEHMRDVHDMILSSGAPFADVAVGDFNVTRGSASLSALLPNMHHAFDDGGHGYAATYYRPFPLYHIDNTLLSDGVRATDYTVIDPGFGRHRLQLARIVFKTSQQPGSFQP